MVQFINVSRIYDNKIAAVQDLNFNIKDGEFIFLIGPSGSGKTTVIKMLIRDEIPSEGKIYFDDTDITKINRQQVYKLRREIGVIFQDYKLVQDKTAYENVAFAMEAAGKKNKEIRETVPYVLDIVGLSNRMKAFPRQLSGGEQQRVAIARAIANNPKLLIADEPTGNLDPASAWDIVQILSKINNWGTTVIMSTHGTDIVNSLNKRVIQMEHGRITRDDNKGQYEMDYSKPAEKTEKEENPLQKISKKSNKTFFKTSLNDEDPDTSENKKSNKVEKQIELSQKTELEKASEELEEENVVYKRRKLFWIIPFFGKTRVEIRKGIEEVLESEEDKPKESEQDSYSEPYSVETEVTGESDSPEQIEEEVEQSDSPKKNKSKSKSKPKKSKFKIKLETDESQEANSQQSQEETEQSEQKEESKNIAKAIDDENESSAEEVNLKNKKVSKKKIQEMLDSKNTPLEALDLPKSILKDLQIAGYESVESVIKDGPDKLAKRITIDPDEVVIISKAIKKFLED